MLIRYVVPDIYPMHMYIALFIFSMCGFGAREPSAPGFDFHTTTRGEPTKTSPGLSIQITRRFANNDKEHTLSFTKFPAAWTPAKAKSPVRWVRCKNQSGSFDPIYLRRQPTERVCGD